MSEQRGGDWGAGDRRGSGDWGGFEHTEAFGGKGRGRKKRADQGRPQNFDDNGSQYGGSQYCGSQHSGSQYGASQQGGSQYGGSQHGASPQQTGGAGRGHSGRGGRHRDWDRDRLRAETGGAAQRGGASVAYAPEAAADHDGRDPGGESVAASRRRHERHGSASAQEGSRDQGGESGHGVFGGRPSHDGSVREQSGELAGELLAAASEHLDGRDVGGVTRALMKLVKDHRTIQTATARGDPRLREVLSRLCQQLRNPDTSVWPRELTDIAFVLGKFQLQDQVVSELLRVVAESAKYRVEHFTPHDMAGIVWGFASLGFRNESLMSVIAAEVVNKVSVFDQRQLANTAWAFAKCGLWNEQLVSAIASECLAKMDTFSAQSLSHLSWAMSQWGTRQEDLMSAIAEESQKKISEFTPAPLAMTAWSFASLQLKNIGLLSAISREAAHNISQFQTRDLAHLAWAFANLRIQDSELFNAMAEELQRNIKGTQPPELANIAWAFSKNNISHEALMSAIAGEAVSQIHLFKPAEVAMLTWAFAVAGLQNKELMTQIGILVAKRVDTFTAPQLSHIAWAFGALSLRHSEFLQALSQHVHANVGAFKAQGLSNIAWAFAMVTFRDEALLLRVAPCIARDAAELRPLALARCAWAYRVLAVQSPELFAAVSAEALRKVDDFPTKALVKLVDSMYVLPAASVQRSLESTLALRMADLARGLRVALASAASQGSGGPGSGAPSWSAQTAEAYAKALQGHGLVDCGIVGTPALLSQLGIGLPSAAFVKRCRLRQASPAAEAPSPALRHGSEHTVAELRVTVGDRELEAWSLQHAGQCSPGPCSQWLHAADLPGRPGRAETTYLALSELCARLSESGADLSSAESRAEVKGAARVLSTLVPGLSSVGALWQFSSLFPNVSLEFAEQVGTVGDS